MRPSDAHDHRRNYVLAFPALGVLGGVYLVTDAIFAVPDALLVSLLALAALMAGTLELAFATASWLQRYEERQNAVRGLDERKK